MQRDLLAERIAEARCDIVAAQEVMGRTRKRGDRVLQFLAKGIEEQTLRSYRVIVGGSRDNRMRNGFLVAEDRFEVEQVYEFYNYPVEPLEPYGPSRHFARGPVGVLLRERAGRSPKLLVVTMHFKSKAFGWKDPTGTKFESLRLEMAQALREAAFITKNSLHDEVMLIIAGDRNAGRNNASSEVLRGERDLKDFKRGNGCVIPSGSVESSCRWLQRRLRVLEEPAPLGLVNSYRFRRVEEQLDVILLEPSHARFVRKGGAVGEYNRGSDHKLIWLELGR